MDECRLTPVELFFLGVLMDAEYIDYEYITSIPEITDNYRIIEQQTLDRLEDKQLIEQEFDGSVTIDEQFQNMLKPVFFGLVESRVLTTWSEGNLHVGNGLYYLLEKMTDDQLKELIMDQELELHSMSFEKGYYDLSFSEEDMTQTELIEKAISIMKGDW